MKTLDEMQREMASLDAQLSPIANRRTRWWEKLRRSKHPLDEAGMRSAAEQLLRDVIEIYVRSDKDSRQIIRDLFDKYRSFAWATTLPTPPTTPEAFRDHLLLFSIHDQGPDPRDAVLWLDAICTQARSAGISVNPILEQIAKVSSDVDKYGKRSTKSWLLKAAIVNDIENCVQNHPPLAPPVKGGEQKPSPLAGEGRVSGILNKSDKA